MRTREREGEREGERRPRNEREIRKDHRTGAGASAGARADGVREGARMKVVSFEIVTHANWSGLIYARAAITETRMPRLRGGSVQPESINVD